MADRFRAAVAVALLLCSPALAGTPTARLRSPGPVPAGTAAFLDALGSTGDAFDWAVARTDGVEVPIPVEPLYDAAGNLSYGRFAPDRPGVYVVALSAVGTRSDDDRPAVAVAVALVTVGGTDVPPTPPAPTPSPGPSPRPEPGPGPTPQSPLDAAALRYARVMPEVYRQAATQIEQGVIATTPELGAVIRGARDAAIQDLGGRLNEVTAPMLGPDRAAIVDRAGYAAVLRRLADAMEGR